MGEKRGLCFLAFSACVSIYRATKQSIFTKKMVRWTKNLVCHHWYKVGMCVDHINSSLDMLINFCTICWPQDKLYRQDKPWKSFRIWILDLFNFSFFSLSFGISNVPRFQFQILFYGILYLKTPRHGTADRLPCRQLMSKIKIDMPTFPFNCLCFHRFLFFFLYLPAYSKTKIDLPILPLGIFRPNTPVAEIQSHLDSQDSHAVSD